MSSSSSSSSSSSHALPVITEAKIEIGLSLSSAEHKDVDTQVKAKDIVSLVKDLVLDLHTLEHAWSIFDIEYGRFWSALTGEHKINEPRLEIYHSIINDEVKKYVAIATSPKKALLRATEADMTTNEHHEFMMEVMARVNNPLVIVQYEMYHMRDRFRDLSADFLSDMSPTGGASFFKLNPLFLDVGHSCAAILDIISEII